MAKLNLNFPKVITVELEDNSLNSPIISAPIALKILNETFKGVVSKDAKWLVPNNYSWMLEKLEDNLIKVTHNLGYANTSLSVSILTSPGSFSIKEHTPSYFVINTNVDFAFSLVKVVSPEKLLQAQS